MSIEVRLFGDLRSLVEDRDRSGEVGITEVSEDHVATIGDVLSFLGLEREDISHTFLNHEYSDLDARVRDGDKVAIFPRNMALLYRWYFRGGMRRTYASGKIERDQG